MKQYYYQEAGNIHGPYTKDEFLSLGLRIGTLIWYTGLNGWVKIETIPELNISKPNKHVNSHKNKISVLLSTFALILLAVIIVTKTKDNNTREEVRRMSYTDPSIDFTMYVDKFYRDLEVYGIRAIKPQNITIKFSRLETTEKYKEWNGVSFGYNVDEIIEIYINPLSWEQSSKARRYWLMYHELAHDVLNAEHVAAIPANEGKLMYPYSTNFEVRDMDEFIEAFHAFFEEYSVKY